MTPTLVVHGGAGDVPDERKPLHVAGCERAARVGLEVMLAGGNAIDAVQRAVEALEDDPLFNAGIGGALAEDGTLELDAAIVDGALRIGAVGALPPFRHPIAIARAVLEDGRHSFLAGDGASQFAIARGFPRTPLEEMKTEAAEERLAKWREARSGRALDPNAGGWAGGTVGAVAIDAMGHVAAATSTGGTVGKRPGRVGDTPIYGAGTCADDEAGAASATGIGESIIRACLTHDVVERMLRGATADVAAREAIERFSVPKYGGSGGVIVVDRHGGVGISRNTRTMTYAIARDGAEIESGG